MAGYRHGCCCCSYNLSGAMVYSYSMCNFANLCGEGALPITSTKYGNQARDLRVFREIGVQIKPGSIVQIAPVDGIESPPLPWLSHSTKSMVDPYQLPTDGAGSIIMAPRALDALYWVDHDPDGETYRTKPRTWWLENYTNGGQDIPPASASGIDEWFGFHNLMIAVGENPYLGINWFLTHVGVRVPTPLAWVSSTGWTPSGLGGSLGCMPIIKLDVEFKGIDQSTGEVFQWPLYGPDGTERPSDAVCIFNVGTDWCPLTSEPLNHFGCWRAPKGALVRNGEHPGECPTESCLSGGDQQIGPEYEDEWTLINAASQMRTGWEGNDPIWGFDVGAGPLRTAGWLDIEAKILPRCKL